MDWLQEQELSKSLDSLGELSWAVRTALLRRERHHLHELDGLGWTNPDRREAAVQRRREVYFQARSWQDLNAVMVDDIARHREELTLLPTPPYEGRVAGDFVASEARDRILRFLRFAPVLRSLNRDFAMDGLEIYAVNPMYAEYLELASAVARALIRIPTPTLVMIMATDDVRVASAHRAKSVHAFQGGLPQ